MKKVKGHLWPGPPPEDTNLQTVPKELYDAATGMLREHGLEVPGPNIHTAPKPDESSPPFVIAKPGEKQPGDEDEESSDL